MEFIKVGIVGKRRYLNYEKFCMDLRAELSKNGIPIENLWVVTGCATGIDAMARKFAEDVRCPLTVYFANWEKYGRPAGPIRNDLIVSSVILLIAFWDGKSKGTKNSISIANKKGVPSVVVNI